jgi:disulfide bond formation protein DsbB
MMFARHGLLAAWITALVATCTSLTLSGVFHYIPCSLCWYQRILMFPLVIILGIGFIKQDRHSVGYALPLACIGLVIALYHSLLQWRLVPESGTCVATVPCSISQLTLLGFITIPFLSLLAFSAITVLLWAYQRSAA